MSAVDAVPKAVAVDAAAVVDAFRTAGSSGGGGGSGGGSDAVGAAGSGGGGAVCAERETTLKELKISRRSTREFSVPVYTAGARVKWEFRLKDYDVNFGVEFVPAAAEAAVEDDAKVVVQPQGKVKASKESLSGSFTVPSPGEVLITIDNGFSYMRSKYVVDLRFSVSGDADTPEGTDPQAVDDGETLHDVGRYELNMETQVNGLGATPERWDPQLRWRIAGVRERLQRKDAELYKRHVAGGFLTNATIVRFLIARGMDIKVTAKLLRQAMAWWSKRNPSYFISDPDDTRAKLLEIEGRTGKIRVPCRDRYGRPLLVFDNEVQNTVDEHLQLDFLAYNMGLCTRTMAPGVDKICLLIHLDRMSMSSAPSMSAIKETIDILGKFFPETLGTAILYQPPRYFIWLYHTIKGLVDPRTSAKVVFIHGDVTDGSKNDAKMKYLIGPNWKQLTGAGQPASPKLVWSERYKKDIAQSPGFEHEVYWKHLLENEAEWAEKHPEFLANAKAEAEAAAEAGAVPEAPPPM